MPSDLWNQRRKEYDDIVAMSNQFDRKGKSMPYTSSNGYMFSQLNKDAELGIRLPKELQQEFLSAYDSGPFLSYGAVMKDYVRVPDSLWEEPATILSYLNQGFEFVNSLPPK